MWCVPSFPASTRCTSGTGCALWAAAGCGPSRSGSATRAVRPPRATTRYPTPIRDHPRTDGGKEEPDMTGGELWTALCHPAPEDDDLWSAFHENSKVGREHLGLPDEAVVERMRAMWESLP